MNRKQTNTMDGLCVELDDENKNEKKTVWSNEYLVIEVIADWFFFQWWRRRLLTTLTTLIDWLIDDRSREEEKISYHYCCYVIRSNFMWNMNIE